MLINNINNKYMMEPMGPEILGFHLDALLMLASGVFYTICALFVYRSYKKDKNELVGALLAFLCYQAVNMFFMGLEMQTMNMLYSNIAALSVLLGSAYMLKFPFSSFSSGTRKVLFLVSIVLALGVFAWFMQTESREMMLMNFTLWYDMVVNGILVGGFMILLALRTSEKWLKIKAFGGGTGVVTCCVVSNGAMLSGALLTSSFFGFLAPIVILGSLMIAKKQQ
jgi:hypothetical protein